MSEESGRSPMTESARAPSAPLPLVPCGVIRGVGQLPLLPVWFAGLGP